MRRYSTTSSLSSFLKSSHSSTPLRSFSMATSSLHLNFDNAILRHLPTSDNTPFQGSKTSPGDTPGICYSMIPDVQPIACPELVLLSSSALALIDFPTTDHQSLPTAEHSTLVSYLCGNVPFPGSRLAAHCYAGHQFGYFSGQLGDGAAVYCGEVLNRAHTRIELQLKGSGTTPYSRSADGRKVLRSSLREFLASEHMAALDIPTTRSGSVVMSVSDTVARDPLYTGVVIHEPKTVISRLASTFLRFGSFELFLSSQKSNTNRQGPSACLESRDQLTMLRQMVDYLAKTRQPDLFPTLPVDSNISTLYREIVQKTATLVAKWRCVGFCHGVLNTDNMSIAGLTLDYGPFGFMEHYVPTFVCNGSDDQGRYAFHRQKEVCLWNCHILAEQLVPLVDQEAEGQDDEPRDYLEELRDMGTYVYEEAYDAEYQRLMQQKLGLLTCTTSASNEELVKSWWKTLEVTAADLTHSFRCLSRLKLVRDQHGHAGHGHGGTFEFFKFDPETRAQVLESLVRHSSTRIQFQRHFTTTLPDSILSQIERMLRREGDNECVEKTRRMADLAEQLGVNLNFLDDELYKYRQRQIHQEHFSQDGALTEYHVEQWHTWLTLYERQLVLGVEKTLAQSSHSLSSVDDDDDDDAALDAWNERRQLDMNAINPVYVLRNHVAEKAIEFAMKRESDKLQHLFNLLTRSPFERSSDPQDLVYEEPLAPGAEPCRVTCSS